MPEELLNSLVESWEGTCRIWFEPGELANESWIGLTDPPWRWKTVFEVVDQDHITITAYNVMPNEPEAKAVETQYVRVAV